MFILNYLKSFLDYFKIFQKRSNLVLLGLDNAGKTTFLLRLKEDRMSIQDPTLYAHSEEIRLGNLLFRIMDLGGHKTMRRIWKNYYMNCDAIIFLVDSAEVGRIDESREELHKILGETNAGAVPILILGNKIDLRSAMSEEELVDRLGIREYMVEAKSPKKRIALYMCSVAKKTGYGEGLLWLNSLLK